MDGCQRHRTLGTEKFFYPDVVEIRKFKTSGFKIFGACNTRTGWEASSLSGKRQTERCKCRSRLALYGNSGYTSRGIYFGSQAQSLCPRSEEHTSELQSRPHLVCRLLLEKKK